MLLPPADRLLEPVLSHARALNLFQVPNNPTFLTPVSLLFQSFFGRSYSNVSSIAECKNNGQCVINKKNRTSCKACRLQKCVMVGMSKSGSRYGRRSNWFKIHCLLQEQQGQHQLAMPMGNIPQHIKPPQKTPPLHHQHLGMGLLGVNPVPAFAPPLLHLPKTKEELMLLGLDEYKHSASPSVGSPESHNSDSSVEVSDARRLPMFPGFLPPTFLRPPGFLFHSSYPPIYPSFLHPANNNNNNNNNMMRNHNPEVEAFNKRVFLDAVLQSQRSPTPKEMEAPAPSESPIQEDPIDLSMKTMSERGSSPAQSDRSGSVASKRAFDSESEEESECDSERELKRLKVLRPTPLDLTTRV
ncbi:hypothetical protein NQ318_020555 [Aromia moschata]|uniref:Nuclear receptor domain-containing protein n=1 Tax=Aromia moschata TaxID=1265417 RepID=A0AAV8Z0J9_9CUCU|nr:hypothetical protein NQ318_020555 [Aromia moschata]